MGNSTSQITGCFTPFAQEENPIERVFPSITPPTQVQMDQISLEITALEVKREEFNQRMLERMSLKRRLEEEIKVLEAQDNANKGILPQGE